MILQAVWSEGFEKIRAVQISEDDANTILDKVIYKGEYYFDYEYDLNNLVDT